MNLGDVERELRHGPPEEDGYRIRELVLDDTAPAPAPIGRLAGRQIGGGLLGRGARISAIAVIVAAASVVAFMVGRLSVPGAAQPAGAASSGVRVQPAFVSDALRHAYYSGAARARTWLVCTATATMDCVDVPAFRTSDFYGTDQWRNVNPGRVAAGDVIVGAQLDPVLPVSAYLVPAADPSAGGPQLVPVTIHPGDTFFDLGQLAPGRYLVSVLTDPTSPMMSGQTVIGIVVE